MVIDSGGSCTRAGLAAAAAAAGAGATAAAAARGLEQLCVFPTLVGRRKTTGMALMGGVGKGASACVAPTTPGGGKARAVFVGHDARRKRGMLTVKAPLEKGLIVDWDAMEKVWHHAFFQELRIDPREHPVLLTERPLQPKESRERVCQVRYRLDRCSFSTNTYTRGSLDIHGAILYLYTVPTHCTYTLYVHCMASLHALHTLRSQLCYWL